MMFRGLPQEEEDHSTRGVVQEAEKQVEQEELSRSVSGSNSEATMMHSAADKPPVEAVEYGNSEISGVKEISDAGTINIRDELGTHSASKLATDQDTSSLTYYSKGMESMQDKIVSIFVAEGDSIADLSSNNAKSGIPKKFTTAEAARVLTVCQNSPDKATEKDIFDLVEIFRSNMPSLQATVVDCLVRVSAFTKNNNYLCSAGCGWVLSQQVQESCSGIVQGDTSAQASMEALSKALTNFSMDPKAQSQLEGTVSPLIDVLLLDAMPESVKLSSLRPLTNLSMENTFHPMYKRVIPDLYELLDQDSVPLRMQSLKVLVNLSLNQELVPCMLSPKAPNSILDLLEAPTPPDLILRMVTMVANIYTAITAGRLDQSSLPPAEKSESPKTMFTALCGVVKMPLLRNKAYRLTRHTDKDICFHASKLYNCIMENKK